MSGRLRLIITTTLSYAFLLPAYAAADVTEKHSVMSVLICERSSLNATTLQFAKGMAVDVFRKAGIDVTWLEGCDAMPTLPRYFVVVIGEQPPAGWISPHAMGFAPIRTGDRRRAYVFMERVRLYVELISPRDRRQSTCGVALGYAMAHELGHLLIPGQGHTVSGIMSPRWSRAEWQDALQGRLVFFEEQARAMRKTLE